MAKVLAPMKRSSTDNTIVEKMKPVVLPHQLLEHLHGQGYLQIHDELKTAYWEHAKRMAWFENHPVARDAAAEGYKIEHLPLFLYGDDAKFSEQEKLSIVMMGCLLDSRKHSMATHWPLFVIRLDSVMQSSILVEPCEDTQFLLGL